MRKNILYLTGILLAAALILGGLNFSSAFAQTPTQTPEGEELNRFIRVNGAGSAAAQPDTAIIVVGVRTEAEEASAALTENNEQVSALLAALDQAGIAQEDIQTQRINLNPRYEEQPGQPGQPVVTGYEAVNTVEVKVRDIDNVGQILDTTVQAGGNLIEQIRFEVNDSSTVMGQAREAAFDDAREKAEQLAGLAGAQLGNLISISESTVSFPRPFAVGGEAQEADRAVPIEPGTQNVQVFLEVTWAISGGQAVTGQQDATPAIPQTGQRTPTVQGTASPSAVVETGTPDSTPDVGSPPTRPAPTLEVGSPTPPADNATPDVSSTEVQPVGSAADQLRDQGADVQEQGDVQHPFFPVSGRVLNVNGEQVQAFEFPTEADAQAAADTILTAQGQAPGQMDDLMMGQIYHEGRAIILYFGEDAPTLDLLSQAFGDPLVE